MNNRVDINNLLTEMRALKAQTQAFHKPQALSEHGLAETGRVNKPTQAPGFGEVMTQALGKVNELQQAASAQATAFEQGQAGIDITDVMVASQKASVAFEATVQVRNKLVEAYRDIMNMPI